MATATKTLAAMVDEGETVWLQVNARDFESSQALSEALDEKMRLQASDLNYLYAERRGEVSIGSDDVELVLTSGGDDAFREWVEGRGFGESRVVHVALDLGLEEVRILVD